MELENRPDRGTDKDRRNDGSQVAQQPKVIASQEIFGRDSEVTIAHAGTHYRLRITRQGKLILNK